MSGKKDTFHIAMAGVTSLGTSRKSRRDVPKGSTVARKGAGITSKAAGSRKVARARRL